MLRSKLTRAMCGLGLLSVLASWPCLAAVSWSRCDQYDGEIRTAVNRWWNDLPRWKLWRAQLYAESGCDAQALSTVGAKGLAQFMEPTWREWSRRIGADPTASPHVAKWAIPAGAAYVRSLRKSWAGRERPIMAQHSLALASYNAGVGSVISAQKQCNDALLWDAIAPCLQRITGAKNAKETTDYVAKIYRFWTVMEEP